VTTRKRFSGSPIREKREELAKQEAALREQMENLERIIADAPKLAEAELERQRKEQVARASVRRSPLDSPDILEDVRHEEPSFSDRRPRPRRAQRRAARMRLLSLLLTIAILVGLVVFLALQLVHRL
jgi:hypothetical protein